MPQFYREAIPWLSTYSGGSTAACGTTSTPVTVPTGANTCLIHAEGAAVYWLINGNGTATATSPGYAAQDQTGVILSIDNFSTLAVIGAGTAAVAHCEFYQG